MIFDWTSKNSNVLPVALGLAGFVWLAGAAAPVYGTVDLSSDGPSLAHSSDGPSLDQSNDGPSLAHSSDGPNLEQSSGGPSLTITVTE